MIRAAALRRLVPNACSRRGLRTIAPLRAPPESAAEPKPTPAATTTLEEKPPTLLGLPIPSFLLKSAIIAEPGYNRWRIPPFAISMHLCIGSVYTWSVFNGPLTRELGGVVSSSLDWGMAEVIPVFSTGIVFLGLTACLTGKWLERVGPRCAATVSAVCWGGGHVIAAAGIVTHSLPLLIFGYGALGGIGLGLGYVAPVSTLIRWFPDRRGMAAGMAVAGFGGAPLIAGPLNLALLRTFYTPPTFLGPASAVEMITDGGRRMASVGGEMVEVVVATAKDLSNPTLTLPPDMLLSEGVYVVGTGSSGAAETFVALGAMYTAVVLASATQYRVPPPGWKPEGWTDPSAVVVATEGPPHPQVTQVTQSSKLGELAETEKEGREHKPGGNDVHIDDAIKTPQFYLLWTVLGCNITAGISILACANTMMTDIFAGALPDTVDAVFCTTFVSAIGFANIVGRLGWASLSDVIGRRAAFNVYFGLGAPLYMSLPFAAEAVSASPSSVPLVAFCGSSMLIFSMYGGGFATIPAYLADTFGTSYVGGIHGRLLTAWSCAGIVGPSSMTYLRDKASTEAIANLASKVDPETFRRSFGADHSQLQLLIDAKSVTITRLMELVPAGTVDPTPFLYATPCNTMAGVLVVACVANNLITPVSDKWLMKNRPGRH